MLSDLDLRSLSELIALASPPACVLCRRELSCHTVKVCPDCAGRVAGAKPSSELGQRWVGRITTAGPYSGVAGELVRSLKFRRLRLAAVEGAAMIGRALDLTHPTLTADEPVIVPVPPAPLRWLARGFDAAEELAIALSTRLELPYLRLLERSNSPRQTGRGRRQRISEPPQVSLVRGVSLPEAPVLLVDDVTTTSSTLESCGRTLREAGIRRVDAVCLARTGSPI